MSQKKVLLPVNEFLAILGAIVSLLVPGRAVFHTKAKEIKKDSWFYSPCIILYKELKSFKFLLPIFFFSFGVLPHRRIAKQRQLTPERRNMLYALSGCANPHSDVRVCPYASSSGAGYEASCDAWEELVLCKCKQVSFEVTVSDSYITWVNEIQRLGHSSS